MRVAHLSWEDRGLLLQALLLVVNLRVRLWLLPFASARRAVLRLGTKSRAPHPVNRLVWAVKTTSRYVPRATCLTQAMAGQALLARSGYKSSVQIGVAKDEKGEFESHAWLIFSEQIVIGGPEVDRYTSLLNWEYK
jgi:hypothetical protein